MSLRIRQALSVREEKLVSSHYLYSLFLSAREHQLRGGDGRGGSRGDGSVKGKEGKERSRQKLENIRSRGKHLTQQQEEVLDWIINLQKRLEENEGISKGRFLCKLEIQRQTYRLYERKTGVLPSEETMKRLILVDIEYSNVKVEMEKNVKVVWGKR